MHKTEFPDDYLLQQNVNISHVLLTVKKIHDNLHSINTNKLKFKLSSPLTTAKVAPDM
jgi:hypothetical protein